MIKKVMELLKAEKIDSDIISPNFVCDFAYNRGIELSSEEVISISNQTKEKHREINISEQFSIFIICVKNNEYLVELHDFHNLDMYREYVSKEELEDMKKNPERYI